MNHPRLTILRIVGRKIAVLILMFVSAAAAFATLGDGKKSEGPKNSPLLTSKLTTNPGSFSLRSGYSYRGSQVINTNEKKYIRLNTVVTMQKGNTTYIVPLKKKVILENVKIELGNRQFRRN